MPDAEDTKKESQKENLFGKNFSEKEQKQLFLQFVIGIVLAELALGVGAVIFSITNARTGADGLPQFQFPWLGYMVTALLLPVLAMLVIHIIQTTMSRPAEGEGDVQNIPKRVRTFYALVRSAPTVILLAALALAGVAVYYLDGIMALLLKLSESFGSVAIWLIGGLTVAWTASYAVRAFMHYKTQQMQAEYAFRHEVLERTGKVLLDARYAPVTDVHMLESGEILDTKALPEGTDEKERADADSDQENSEQHAEDTGEHPNAAEDNVDNTEHNAPDAHIMQDAAIVHDAEIIQDASNIQDASQERTDSAPESSESAKTATPESATKSAA